MPKNEIKEEQYIHTNIVVLLLHYLVHTYFNGCAIVPHCAEKDRQCLIPSCIPCTTELCPNQQEFVVSTIALTLMNPLVSLRIKCRKVY